MTDPKGWPRGIRVELDGRPWHPAKTLVFIGAFVVLCGAIVVWRQTLGRI